MKRMMLVPITLALLLGWVSTASAASLTVTWKHDFSGTTLTYSGTADETSTLEPVQIASGSSCPGTPAEAQAQPRAVALQALHIEAGPFTVYGKTDTRATDPNENLLICSYLTAGTFSFQGSTYRVVATGSTTVTPRAVATAGALPGVYGDGAVNITPDLNGTKRVKGGARLLSQYCPGTNPPSGGSGPRATVHYKVTEAAQAKYNLPSRTIIKVKLDDTTRIPGSNLAHRFEASQAMSNALGRIKRGERIKVSIKVSFTHPIVKVFTKTITLTTGKDGDGWVFEKEPSGCSDDGGRG